MPNDAAPEPDALTDAALSASETFLDAEKLDCYQLAVEFQALAAGLLPKHGYAALRDQLDRASISVALNIAEGAGRCSPADKARIYAIARGSATECAAILDVASSRGLGSALQCRRGRALLVRIVQMLSRLIAHDRSSRVAVIIATQRT